MSEMSERQDQKPDAATEMQWIIDDCDRYGYGAKHPTSIHVRNVMEKVLADLTAAKSSLDAMRERVTSLENALQTIVDGIPRPKNVTPYRTDGMPSKMDKCAHGMFMYDDCGECIAEFARAALSGQKDESE